jgi:hypothetical protein
MRLRFRPTIAALAAALVIASGVACAVKVKGRTPEGLVADYGVKIGQTVSAAQETVGAIGKASTNQKVRDGAVLALKGLDAVNTNGLKLADVLDKIIALRQANQPIDGTLFDQALALVDAIDNAIALDVIPHLGDSPEARAGLEAARAVSKLALSIQLQLGELKGS